MDGAVSLSPCNSEKVQKAVDDLKEGGVVFFEPGIFEFETPVLLSSNIKLIGAGRDATKIVLAKNASCHIFGNKDHKKGNENIEISRLAIDGNMEHQSKPKDLKSITFACAFYFRLVRNAVFSDLFIENIRQTGLHFNHCSHVRVRNYICRRAGWSGVSTSGTDHIDIEASVADAGLDIRHSGVHLDGGKGARFVGSVSHTTGNGIMLDSTFGDFSHAFIDAHVTNCKRGVSLSGTHQKELRSVFITGCFANNESSGVMVSNASDIIIQGASFLNNKEMGLLFQGRNGGRDSIVSDCVFTNNGDDIVELHASRGIDYFNNMNTVSNKMAEVKKRAKKNKENATGQSVLSKIKNIL